MKEYRKKTGKRVKTYSELMQLMKTTIADTAQPALTPSKLGNNLGSIYSGHKNN